MGQSATGQNPSQMQHTTFQFQGGAQNLEPGVGGKKEQDLCFKCMQHYNPSHPL
jgi:hypothetical protein